MKLTRKSKKPVVKASLRNGSKNKFNINVFTVGIGKNRSQFK